MLTSAFRIFNFLTYGTRPRWPACTAPARRRTRRARRQALWLGLVVGVGLRGRAFVVARRSSLIGGDVGSREEASPTCAAPPRRARLPGGGGGQGFLRGTGDLLTPLWILVAAQAANVVLEASPSTARLGTRGLGLGTVIAQPGMAAVRRGPGARAGFAGPDLARTGR